jgi:hypothetical protein
MENGVTGAECYEKTPYKSQILYKKKGVQTK